MEMKLLTPEQLAYVYNRDLVASFPREELKPLRAMEIWHKDGSYRPWGLFDGDEIVGVGFVWAFEEGWRLFDYLCVAPHRRNDGLGSLVIQKLVEAERGNVLFGEAEVPEFAPDVAMAQRRQNFYKRNGAKEAGYDMTLFGVVYRVLYWSDEEVPAEQIMQRHKALYLRRFGPEKYDKYINIPWTAEDGVPEALDWSKLEAEIK